MNNNENLFSLCSRQPADRKERLRLSDEIYELAFRKGDSISKLELEMIIDWLRKSYDYPANDRVFEIKGHTFQDWFTRKLKTGELEKLRAARKPCFISSPCEADLINCGPSSDPIKIKKDMHVIPREQFVRLNLDPECQVINFRLRKPHYHWIHSPCEGTVKIIFAFGPGNNDLFGGNSITCISIGNDVTLLMIGERSVQSFQIVDDIDGKKAETGDFIGNFNYGSQVLMLNYNHEHTELMRSLEQRIFILDPLIK